MEGTAMAERVLYDFWRSSASYRVRIGLHLKGIEHRAVPVNLAEGAQAEQEYRARNPQGFVPMLEDGEVRISQSLAILEYLDAIRPEPPLLPAAPAEAAHVRALAMTIACDIHPLNNLRVLKHLTGALGQSEAEKSEWMARWIREGFFALEALAEPQAGRFLFGDMPGLADILLVPQMYNARRFSVPLDEFPLLVRVDAEACALPAFQAAHPDRVAPAN
jgi:maleylacetoacetate isomerase